jgi:hypothetical protein
MFTQNYLFAHLFYALSKRTEDTVFQGQLPDDDNAVGELKNLITDVINKQIEPLQTEIKSLRSEIKAIREHAFRSPRR